MANNTGKTRQVNTYNAHRLTGQNWRNWSGLQRTVARETLLPCNTQETVAAVNEALNTGRTVRAIGSGHSFTATAVAPDMQLDLSKMQGLIGIDRDKKQVTLRAGTKLWQIPELIKPLGLAMQNLGDINTQSISGAVSTSTHGTGLKFGGLGSQVAGLKMVTGTGEILTVDDSDTEKLDALRVSLGAYGIITEITLQLVDDYDLHVIEDLADFDSTTANWQELNETNDHFEFFWFGHANKVITKTSQRLAPHTLPRTAASPVKDFLNDKVVGNAAFAAVCWAGKALPKLTNKFNSVTTAGWGKSNKVKHWSAGFASPRLVRFNEMEFCVPFAAVPEVLRELKSTFAKRGLDSTFPLEVRAAAADSGWLASNHGRQSGYIAVHKHISQDFTDYFKAAQEVFMAHEGRPHWGKLHWLTANDFSERYAHWQDSLALRNELDPNRIFTNPYLRQVMGA